MSKSKKLTDGGRLITRAELQFFARAVDARIAQEVGKLRQELMPLAYPMLSVPTDIQDGGIVFDDGTVVEFKDGTVVHAPTDSEGAE